MNDNGVLEAGQAHHNNRNNKFTVKDMSDPSIRYEFTLYILNQYYVLLSRGIDGIRLDFWENDEFGNIWKKC